MSSKIIGKISNKKLLKKLTEIDAEKVAVRRILDELLAKEKELFIRDSAAWREVYKELGISESERKIQLNLTTGEVSEATDEICEAAD